VKVGILGAGNISDTHARAALGIPGVEIAAVCGTNREKAEGMAAKYGGTAYDDLNRFLAHRPLDIVEADFCTAVGSSQHQIQARLAVPLFERRREPGRVADSCQLLVYDDDDSRCELQ